MVVPREHPRSIPVVRAALPIESAGTDPTLLRIRVPDGGVLRKSSGAAPPKQAGVWYTSARYDRRASLTLYVGAEVRITSK